MSKAPNTIHDLVDRFGKVVTFADEMGIGYEAARKMRDRGAIAPKHWPRLLEVCRARGIEGVTYEWLAAQYQANRTEAA